MSRGGRLYGGAFCCSVVWCLLCCSPWFGRRPAGSSAGRSWRKDGPPSTRTWPPISWRWRMDGWVWNINRCCTRRLLLKKATSVWQPKPWADGVSSCSKTLPNMRKRDRSFFPTLTCFMAISRTSSKSKDGSAPFASFRRKASRSTPGSNPRTTEPTCNNPKSATRLSRRWRRGFGRHCSQNGIRLRPALRRNWPWRPTPWPSLS